MIKVYKDAITETEVVAKEESANLEHSGICGLGC